MFTITQVCHTALVSSIVTMCAMIMVAISPLTSVKTNISVKLQLHESQLPTQTQQALSYLTFSGLHGLSQQSTSRLSETFLVQSLVDIIKHGLTDENQKVKTITSLSIAALAEAAAPYGIESFDDVLEPLWKGIRLLR